MNAASGFRCGNPLNSVYAAFVLKSAVGSVGIDQEDDLLDAAHGRDVGAHDFVFPAVSFCIASIHAVQLTGKEGCLAAPSSGADFHHDTLVVVGVLGQKK